MYTKRLIITEAFAELRLAGYVFDLTAEELQGAARRLEVMIAAWAGDGIDLGYVHAADAQAIDLDAQSGVALRWIRAVVCWLAMDIAANYGKQVHSQTIRSATDGMSAMLSLAAFPPTQSPKMLPRGAGNRYSEGEFFSPPNLSSIESADGGLDFRG